MFNIIVLETLIDLGFFVWFFLGGGFFEEFDLFCVLLLFCLFGPFFTMEGFLLYLKQACHCLQIKNCPLLRWFCPRGVVVWSSSEHTCALFLQGFQAVHCSPVVSNSQNFLSSDPKSKTQRSAC